MKSRKKKPPRVYAWDARDGPTPEQEQKFTPQLVKTGEIDSEQGVALAYRVTDNSPLATLYRRGGLSEAQYRAGEAHYRTYQLARVEQRVTSSYGEGLGGGETTYGMPATERIAHHRKRLREAEKLLRRDTRKFFSAIVIDHRGLIDVGYEIIKLAGKPKSRSSAYRTSRRILERGLDNLAIFYGIRA